MKYTPGPWRLFSYADTLQVGTDPSPGESRCAVVHWSGFDATDKSIKERKANALLISAAPQMLEAIQKMKQAYDDDDLPRCLRAVRDSFPIIKKALGDASQG